MKGKYVYLRGIQSFDIEILSKWNFDEEIERFFPPKLPNSDIEQKLWFEQQTTGNNKKKLIICDIEDNCPIGLISIMNIDHINKNCEIGISIGEKNFFGSPHSSEAFLLVLSFLFRQYNMHIVYCKTFESNWRAIKFVKKFGFEEEGILKDRIFRNNSYESWVCLSLSSSRWNDQ